MLRLMLAITVILLLLTGAGKPRSAHAQLPVGYDTGWSLVSGPTGSHLVGATGSLYSLLTGNSDYSQVPATSALQACRGYWAYFPNGGSLDATGSSSTPSCSIKTTPGQWSMIGNPSTSRASVIGADIAYTYLPGSGYQGVQEVPTGRGLWVIGPAGVTITALSAASGGGSSAVPPVSAAHPPAVLKGSTGNLSDGWQLRVNSVTLNGTAAVLAANSLNKPPPAGSQYVLVNVTATYAGSGTARFDDSYRLHALGASGQTYAGFGGSGCPVIPLEVPGSSTTSGGSVTGNTCWTIPANDTAGLLLVDEPSPDPTTWSYFALQ